MSRDITRVHTRRNRTWDTRSLGRDHAPLPLGPVMAGVIGRQKSGYDIWGDTVNTASRLESTAPSGVIQVSDVVYERLFARYRFSEPYVVDLKGKGPTKARLLHERLSAELAPALRAVTDPSACPVSGVAYPKRRPYPETRRLPAALPGRLGPIAPGLPGLSAAVDTALSGKPGRA